LYWLLRTSVRERGPLGIHRPVLATWDIRSRKRPFELSLPSSYSLSGGTGSSIQEGNRSRSPVKTQVYGQQIIREGVQRLYERPAKDLFRHDATSVMEFVHQLDIRTHGLASGCPMVVIVQPAHDRKSDHLLPCLLTARNRSALFRDLLPNPLMRSRLVEVGDITIEHTVELPLIEDQQMVETFLPHTPQEALADRIGSRSVIGCFEDLDAAGCGHARETGSNFAITIAHEIVRRLPIGGCFSQRYAPPKHRSAIV
jgi:hypothetical protein